ncbi:carbohydrate ABC transporter permease [Saliterribacillus persicus]|uniref:Carbohydrate ABC transporter membrane protein 2 (CUT1 family) n=1 Tax=Saliterribacillus persicus TaxID=930114 RepID=A0A368YAR8_9BACI|nr:carbohydrate ABC transporter permease [Saliterribacillus persicus]RCW77343.1 carbohydrate ABC transporter membrane protein 2 (CUT1 family) [Saliterribacillus persicus]
MKQSNVLDNKNIPQNGNNIKLRKSLFSLFTYFILLIVAVVMVMPFVWMLSGSLKDAATIFQDSMNLIPDNPRWDNYPKVWTSVPFAMFYWNTTKVAFLTTVGTVLTSALAAYAFAKLEFPGRDKIFFLYIATMMIPDQVTMIPQFVLMRDLGLINTHTALILVKLFHPFGVFLLRQFFLTIPNELSDSARIDGCSEFRIFWNIILPLSKAALGTLVIFSLLNSWNDFINPLIYLSDQSLFTLQVGIRYFQQLYGADYHLIMAATTLSLIPIIIVYLFAQKYFIEGISTTGLKG